MTCQQCDKINIARAAVILAWVMGLVSVGVLAKAAFRSVSGKLANAAHAMNVLAGLWMLVAFSVWADLSDDFADMDFGFCFGLAIASWLLFWVSSLLAYFADVGKN